MAIRSLLCATVSITLLAGCVPENMNALQMGLTPGQGTGVDPEVTVKSWVGETVGNLYAVYGEPSKIIDLPEGGKVYTYNQQSVNKADNSIAELAGMFGASDKTISKLDQSNKTSVKKCVINFKTGKSGKIDLATIVENNKTMFGTDCDSLAKPAP